MSLVAAIYNTVLGMRKRTWASSIWAEYYRRKALVTYTSQDDHDFTSFGPIPYTVPELQAEAGL